MGAVDDGEHCHSVPFSVVIPGKPWNSPSVQQQLDRPPAHVSKLEPSGHEDMKFWPHLQDDTSTSPSC